MSSKVNMKAQVVISVFLVLLGSTASAGRIIKVPLDFDNIQAAIDDANDGDLVFVSDGIYVGDGNRDIDFAGKAIVVRSENGPTNCIIDCRGSADEQHMGFLFRSGEGPNSILDGFTITNGHHEEAGAILCTYVHINGFRPSNPTLINCVITNNRGTYAGAIRCGSGCEPVISNCVISDNIGAYTGGISYADESRPTISNCIVRSNSGSSGGGIRTGGARCHGTIRNCVISGNSATGGTAGVHWWSYGGSVEITNCTIVGNEDELWTGGIVIGGGGGTTGVITNCIVWGNRGLGWPLAQIYLWPGADPPTTAEVTYCDVEGGWPGEGNIDADPLFVDADGAVDLHLLGGSPCLDAGDNSAVPVWMTKDVEGNPRIVNGIVDMGAYEGPNQGLVVRPLSVTVGEGQTSTFTVALSMAPGGSVEVTSAVTSGDPDIVLASGAVVTFDSSNYDQPRTVTLSAAEDEDFENGSALVTVNAPSFHSITVYITESENDHTLYVDANAPGANTGTSWADAFNNLQDALAAAAANPHISEILVAQGIYRPDQGVGQMSGDREASFGLVNGVYLKGGYAGCGEPDPNARDIELYETILSGDLDGNDIDVNDPCDLLTEATRSENSYHIITWIGVACHEPESNTLIEGFTVSGGNANGESSWPDEWSCGGGLYNYSGKAPMITKCKFTGNSASNNGGGILGWQGRIVNCLITKNAAGWNGGGLSQCSGLIKDCTISSNFATYRGGGYEMWEGDTHFHNCTFSNNTADTEGGGMFFADAEPRLSNCTFSGNVAGVNGGGISSVLFDYAPKPVLINCDFSQNTASEVGGGMCNTGSYSRLTNCIFSVNSARCGGGMANYDGSNVNLANCTFAENSGQNGNALACDTYNPRYPWPSELQVSNCILWNGGNEVFNGDNSEIQITYSDVEGGWPGVGNIDTDPCFVDSGEGDYHLKSQAGRWDANEGRWTKDDVTSPCIDAGEMAVPIGLEPFPNGGVINMGAYGGTAEASKSYFGEPICETIVAGDINGDCRIDFKDFVLMAAHWLENNSP